MLYFVEMKHKQSNDVFHKIGITKHSVNQRLSSRHHNINILATLTGTLYEMYTIEQRILSIFKQCQYSPLSMSQNGSTECLLLDDVQVDVILKIHLNSQIYSSSFQYYIE